MDRKNYVKDGSVLSCTIIMEFSNDNGALFMSNFEKEINLITKGGKGNTSLYVIQYRTMQVSCEK